MHSRQIRSILASALLAGLPVCSFAALSDAAQIDLKISSEPLNQALTEFASQSGIQVIFFSKATEGLLSPSLHGRFTPKAALERLLGDSPLTYREINPNTIEIHPKAAVNSLSTGNGDAANSASTSTSNDSSGASAIAGSGGAYPRMRLAQAEAGGTKVAESDSNTVSVTEVTVTARRVSERLQSTPLAVTAFGDAMLQQLSVVDALDLSGRAPNVQILQTGAGAGAASIFIRGIGNNALGFNLESPVGLYVDDVYLPRLQGSLVDLLDLERIEVLRGPQGTLYGRDSTVGAVKYVSKDPDLYEPHYAGRAVFGDYDRRDTLLGASIPIVPGQLAIKMDVSSRDQEGYMIGVDATGKPDGRRGNGINRQSGRVAVLWTPNENWRINYVADISNDDSGSTQPTPISSPQGTMCTPAVAPCRTLFDSPYKTGINLIATGYADSWGQSARVEYETGWAVIKSITAYRRLKALDVIDQTRIPGAGLLLPDFKDQDQFSEEIQVASTRGGPFTWLAGLVYFRESIDHTANFYGNHLNDDSQVSDSYGAFLNLNYEIVDGLHVELGGRITEEERSIDRTVLPINGGAPLIDGSASFSESKSTYKVGLDYAITPDVMVYATHSTGYRPGSFSSTYASPVVAPVVFGHTAAETAVSNEIGIKSDWFGRRLRANLAAFDTDYKNLQTQATTFPYNVTATDFKFKGVELELEARPIEELSFYASIGVLDADTLSGPAEGRRPRLTPDLQYSVGAEYRVTLNDGTVLFVNANDVYTSEYTTDPSNVSSATQDAYSLVGANVGAEFQDGRYRVSLGGKNLTDEAYFNGTSLNRSQYFAQPRTVFLELEVKL